jgi:hypothetical protein
LAAGIQLYWHEAQGYFWEEVVMKQPCGGYIAYTYSAQQRVVVVPKDMAWAGIYKCDAHCCHLLSVYEGWNVPGLVHLQCDVKHQIELLQQHTYSLVFIALPSSLPAGS